MRQKQARFKDFRLDEMMEHAESIKIYGGKVRARSIHIYFYQPKLVLVFTKKRSLYQLLGHADLNSNIMQFELEQVLDRLKFVCQKKHLIASAYYYCPDDKDPEREVWIVYRVATPKYTPIPHRVIAETVAKKLNLWEEPDIFRLGRHWYIAWKVGEKFVQPDVWEAWLVIRNANTAQDGIRVGLAFKNRSTRSVRFCWNGTSVIHVGEPNETLSRVVAKATEMVKKAKEVFEYWIDFWVKLEAEPVTEEELQEVLNELPKKYWRWFWALYSEIKARYGATKRSLAETLAVMASKVKYDSVRDLLNRLEKKVQKA